MAPRPTNLQARLGSAPPMLQTVNAAKLREVSVPACSTETRAGIPPAAAMAASCTLFVSPSVRANSALAASSPSVPGWRISCSSVGTTPVATTGAVIAAACCSPPMSTRRQMAVAACCCTAALPLLRTASARAAAPPAAAMAWQPGMVDASSPSARAAAACCTLLLPRSRASSTGTLSAVAMLAATALQGRQRGQWWT